MEGGTAPAAAGEGDPVLEQWAALGAGEDDPAQCVLAHLGRLETLAQELTRAERYADAIRTRERSIEIKSQLQGHHSTDVEAEKLEIAELYCAWALHHLYTKDVVAQAKRFLRMADQLTVPQAIRSPELSRQRLSSRAVMHGHMACILKREGRLRAALVSARKAVQIHERMENWEGMVSSLLTSAALLSSMSRHQEGLEVSEQALQAVLRLEDERWRDELVRRGVPDAGDQRPDTLFYGPLQAMCFNNIAVEQEHLGAQDTCLRMYQTAFQLAYMALGASHPLTVRFKESFTSAHRIFQESMQRDRIQGLSAVLAHNPETVQQMAMRARDARKRDLLSRVSTARSRPGTAAPAPPQPSASSPATMRTPYPLRMGVGGVYQRVLADSHIPRPRPTSAR